MPRTRRPAESAPRRSRRDRGGFMRPLVLSMLGLWLGMPVAGVAAPAAEATFRVERVDLAGADLLPATEWQPLLDAVAGREIGFGQLEALRAALEARFHVAGWRLARVRIPAQT
ncbi:MAG: hypothetical protein K1X51_14595, partial [Rhodospirillaceae bacterium]|nr:hypothetical protein [Rhodospirillaceae bacterium]